MVYSIWTLSSVHSIHNFVVISLLDYRTQVTERKAHLMYIGIVQKKCKKFLRSLLHKQLSGLSGEIRTRVFDIYAYAANPISSEKFVVIPGFFVI